MAKIACPYCHRTHTLGSSTDSLVCDCGHDLPKKFLRAARRNPPVFLATVGSTGHGKTTYLDSLAITIENLGKISRGVYHDYLDDFSFDEIRSIRRQTEGRQEREPTGRSRIPQPLLISLRNFLDHDFSTLVIYDLAGEIFDRRDDIDEYATPLRYAQTVWFFVSLPDLRENNDAGRTISDLFNVYQIGMERLGVETKGRNLLVIYTKADKLANEWPVEVRNYVRQDPYATLDKLKLKETADRQIDEYAYVQQLQRISDELAEYTYDEVEGGVAFVNMVRESGMHLAFCAVSSLGRESAGGANQMIEYRRYRVLDPLIWALTRNEGIDPTQPMVLILDGGMAEARLHGDIPRQFFEALSELGTVMTYFLGDTTIAGPSGSLPEKAPNRQLLPLIGPLLEQLPVGAFVLAIVERSIVDLDDFEVASWSSRLGIVHFSTPNLHWPKLELISEISYPAERIVNKFFVPTTVTG